MAHFHILSLPFFFFFRDTFNTIVLLAKGALENVNANIPKYSHIQPTKEAIVSSKPECHFSRGNSFDHMFNLEMKEDEEEEYTPDQPEQDQEPPREGTQEDVLRSGMQKETIMQLNHRLALTHLVDVLCSTHSFGKPLIQVRVLVARYFVPQPFVEEISVSFFFLLYLVYLF